jgi:hypothetical protein
MRQKAMDKEVAKQIWKRRRKEKKDKQAKKTLIVLIVIEKFVERKLVKQQWTNFITTWSSLVVKKVGDRFHSNFKAGLQAHPLRYMGVNLGDIK